MAEKHSPRGLMTQRKDPRLLLDLLRWSPAEPAAQENVVAKPNYRQARKQRELTRKARQHEKQQRRSARTKVADASPQVEPLENAASAPNTPVAGGERDSRQVHLPSSASARKD